MSKNTAWYSEESGLFGEMYFKIFGENINNRVTPDEITFLEKELNLKPGDAVFDLCCGYGRHSVELAKRGYDVTGQDLSSNFLKMAEESAAKEGVKINFVHDDMRSIRFENEFDAAIIMFSSFGVLETDEENQKVLNGIARSLKNGGRFIIDTANRDKILAHYIVSDKRIHSDETTEIINRKYDHNTGIHSETRELINKDSFKKQFNIVLRFYTIPEYINMMSNAGLKFINSCGDFYGNPVSFDSSRYILIAEKV